MASTPRGVHQVLATLGYGDAIGHEVIGIQRVLRAAGFHSEIFVETADPRLEHLTLDYRELPGASHPDNVLIHHFSIGSRASRVAYALPDRMALVYHNITPPEYFIGVHPLLVQLCFMGRRELGAYVPRVSLALGDSEFNRQELEAAGFRETAVLPVVPSFAHLEVPPSPLLAAQFDDDWVNLLFVGRVIPNKRLDDAIRIFAAYKRRLNPRSRLIFVGSHAGFDLYFAMLQQLVDRLRLPDVHFVGHVTNEELTAFYDVADVFLCASEHEGFCVPLVEAFHKQVPVIARAATAVPATMDGGGVLYEDTDPAHVAQLVDAVVSDATLRAAILAAQDAALARLVGRDFGATLLRFVDRVAALPVPEQPGVAFDFWDQYARQDALEELRIHRPAFGEALPAAQRGDADGSTRRGRAPVLSEAEPDRFRGRVEGPVLSEAAGRVEG
jgi:glycosyltransferase involved in cell wall biosynthesis